MKNKSKVILGNVTATRALDYMSAKYDTVISRFERDHIMMTCFDTANKISYYIYDRETEAIISA